MFTYPTFGDPHNVKDAEFSVIKKSRDWKYSFRLFTPGKDCGRFLSEQ